MFSRFLKSTITFFSSSSTTASLGRKPEGGQQLQAELAEAAAKTMVSTRSQDHVLPGNDVQGDLVVRSQPVLNKKRKEDQSPGITPNKTATKRRRKESVTEAITTETIVTVDDGANGHDIPSSTRSAQLSFDLSQPQSDEATEQVVLSSNNTASKSQSSSGKFSHIAIAINSTNGSTPNDTGKPSSKGKVPKKRRKSQDSNLADELPASEPASNAPKATHKRFGSEDLIPPSTNTEAPSAATPTKPNNEAENDAESDAESSDEAPETVTASAGLDQARAASSEAAKAVKREVELKRQKRKDRDVRLKEQAKLSKKHRKPSPVDEPSDKHPNAADTNHPTQNKILLLPPSILSAPPPTRLPTPPPITQQPPNSPSTININRKLKLLNADSKPPKDLKRGPVTVRVLEKDKGLLPPKVSQSSKVIREAWLLGRKGTSGTVAVPRRKVGGRGFVRNR